MRVLVTGATGYVGQSLTPLLKEAGHTVSGLARSEASEEKLKAAGVIPVRGDLEDAGSLTAAAQAADAVIHLAYVPDFDNYGRLVAIERAAVAALRKGLEPGKHLVTTNGSAFLGDTGPSPADETAPIDTNSYFAPRAGTDSDTLSAAEQGIRSAVLRLPLYVYGRGGSVFVPVQLGIARRDNIARYIGSGENRVSSLHVDDVARAYVLALNAPAGSLYHLSDGLDPTARQIAEAVAANVGCGSRGVGWDEAVQAWGPGLSAFFQLTNRLSAEKIGKELGWRPQVATNLLDDIAAGSYRS